MPKTVLITGAAGGVAGYLRRELGDSYRLVLSDLHPIKDLAPHEVFRGADLGDLDALRRLMPGVDAIVHLGGQSVEGPWSDVLDRNIVGAYNLFEAARLEGVTRVVFASSCHAVGFYRLDETIEADAYFKPDTRYGVSKVFGEALGSLYAHKYGFDVLALRIGNVGLRPVDRRRLHSWLSPRDLAGLVRVGIETPNLGYEVVFGMSRNTGSCWVNTTADRLGYVPLDDAADYAEEINQRPFDPDAAANVYQGGPFVEAETGGDPSKGF